MNNSYVVSNGIVGKMCDWSIGGRGQISHHKARPYECIRQEVIVEKLDKHGMIEIVESVFKLALSCLKRAANGESRLIIFGRD